MKTPDERNNMNTTFIRHDQTWGEGHPDAHTDTTIRLGLGKGSTREQAEAIAGQFPKSYRVVASISYGAAFTEATVVFQVSRKLNATTGDANETGEARLRKFIAKAEALGYTVEPS